MSDDKFSRNDAVINISVYMFQLLYLPPSTAVNY